jgi:serine/threonine protein kinase
MLWQQLGDCLGKGAFGSVYRALNWGTGETVAIKQVRLADLPKTELKSMMVSFAPSYISDIVFANLFHSKKSTS